MRIVERRPGGYVATCNCRPGEPFPIQGLMLTAECPFCGRPEHLADLVAEWVITARERSTEEAAD